MACSIKGSLSPALKRFRGCSGSAASGVLLASGSGRGRRARGGWLETPLETTEASCRRRSGGGLGLLLAGVLLDLIGFAEGGGAVSAEVSFRLAFLFGPAVGVLFVTAGVILWFLPLDNALHDRIQRIAQRRWER